MFRFNKLTLDTDETEEDRAPVSEEKGSELESEAKTSDMLLRPSFIGPASTSPETPLPLSFLNETKEGENKPAILKLLDTAQLSSASFVLSSIKVHSHILHVSLLPSLPPSVPSFTTLSAPLSSSLSFCHSHPSPSLRLSLPPFFPPLLETSIVNTCPCCSQLRKSGEGVAETHQDVGGARQLSKRVSVSTVREVKGRIDEASVFRESGSELVRGQRIVAVAVGTNHTAMVTG